jgi:hypothetical protein
MWSCAFRTDGKLLENKDLLKGDIVRPMAEDLSANWPQFREAMLKVADSLLQNGLTYREQFFSLTSLSVLFGWSLHTVRWQASHEGGWLAAQKQEFEDLVAKSLATNIDRWLLVSQWAGRWAQAGSYTLAYAKRLHEFGAKLSAVVGRDQGLASIKKYFDDELTRELLDDAKAYVDGLGASRRSGVRNYHVVLWLWHRLDADRWKHSKLPLRDRSRKVSKLEVDHVVAVYKWEVLKAADPSFNSDDSTLHSIGNCLLLEKSFNISKGKRTMAEFLGDIASLGAQGAKELLDSLLISEGHSSLQSQTLATLEVIVEERESIIKKELKEFIDGSRVRQDA